MDLETYKQDESAMLRSFVFTQEDDDIATAYQDEITNRPTGPTKLFLDLIPQYGKSCLDVGMSYGAQYFALREQCPDIVWTGVDILQTYDDKLRARITDGSKPETILVKSYFPSMAEIPDASYDVVTARSLLTHYSHEHGFQIIDDMLRIATKAVIVKFYGESATRFTCYSQSDDRRGAMRINVVWGYPYWRDYLKDKKATPFGKDVLGQNVVWVLEK